MANKDNYNISADKTILSRLKGYFKIGVKPSATNKIDKIQLYKAVKTDEKDSKGNYKNKLVLDKFPDSVQTLWKYWVESCHDDINSWKDMINVYNDMDQIYYNCSPIAKSIEIIVDEVLQADSNNQTIFIEGKQKIKKYIENFFQEINLYEHLRPAVKDIVKYGNALWVLGFDNKGINEIVQVDPRMLRERMEFSPFELNAKINSQDKLISNYRSSVNRVDDLIDMILNKENSVSYFKTYLIGFQVEETVLPPWKCIHFRNTTNDSPFKPYGVPMYIHAMAPYRQYDAAMALQVTARGAMFPKQIYKINLPNIVSPTEKFTKATEFMNELLNSGFGSSKKELPGLGDIIITIDDLFTYDQVKYEVDLSSTDDLQMLKDEILDATLLPRKLIDARDSGFGDSGVALAEQFKPFARLIYRFQSILMTNLTELIKIHLLHTGEFTLDEIEFNLNMPYPESQTNNDLISSQNSLLDLANNIIAAIEDKITGGEKLPPDLIKSIYNKFLPYDSNIVDVWVDEAIKAKDTEETTPTADSRDADYYADENYTPETDEDRIDDNDIDVDQLENEGKVINISESAKKRWRMIEKAVGKKKLKEMVDDIIFEESAKVLREGSYRGRHYFSSKNKTGNFDVMKFEKICRKTTNKLVEKEMKEHERANIYEEYKFVIEKEPKEE
jgi:uncharacterized protein (DUF427 family)